MVHLPVYITSVQRFLVLKNPDKVRQHFLLDYKTDRVKWEEEIGGNAGLGVGENEFWSHRHIDMSAFGEIDTWRNIYQR